MALKRVVFHGKAASDFLSEFVKDHYVERCSMTVQAVNDAYLVVRYDPSVKIVKRIEGENEVRREE